MVQAYESRGIGQNFRLTPIETTHLGCPPKAGVVAIVATCHPTSTAHREYGSIRRAQRGQADQWEAHPLGAALGHPWPLPLSCTPHIARQFFKLFYAACFLLGNQRIARASSATLILLERTALDKVFNIASRCILGTLGDLRPLGTR